MKKLCFFTAFICFSFLMTAQEHYTINGENLELKLEEEGKLDLLTLKLEKGYRFFVKDETEAIKELLNIEDNNNPDLKQYQVVLQVLIKNPEISINDIGYGRYSLKHFIKAYNSNDNRILAYTNEKVKAQFRLGFFGGLTNHPFIDNIDNSLAPFFGAELELFERKEKPRHAGYFNIFQTIESGDLDYSSTQMSLGYRYRFINNSRFNLYGNLTFAAYNFDKAIMVVGNDSVDEVSESGFNAPFAFGIGADFKLNDTSFITLIYNSLFAIFTESGGNFPLDLALGYKFNI